MISPSRILEGFHYDFDQMVWLVQYESENYYKAYDAIHTQLIQFQRTVQTYSNVKLSFTYQELVGTLVELQLSLKELLLHQQKWFYIEEDIIIPFKVRKIEFSKENIFHHYTNALDEWKKVIIEGDLHNAQELVNRWVDLLKEKHYHPESVKSWLHNLIVSVELHFNYIFHNDKQHTDNLHSEIHSLINVYQLKRYTLDFFQRLIEFVQSSSKMERLEVWEAKRYVEQRLNERISMEAVAKHLYMNPSHFSRIFKKETGETFIEYVIRKKMEKAASYLRETDETIEEIAYQLGYENTSYFIKLFKKLNQISPLEYRKAN